MIDISSYKYDGLGGRGVLVYVYVVLLFDGYCGCYWYGDGDDDDVVSCYVVEVIVLLDDIEVGGKCVVVFIVELIFGCGG